MALCQGAAPRSSMPIVKDRDGSRDAIVVTVAGEAWLTACQPIDCVILLLVLRCLGCLCEAHVALRSSAN